MPIEPAPSPWVFADLRDPELDAALDDLVGIGADLAPGTLLAAYRSGLFPMPGGDDPDDPDEDEVDPDEDPLIHWYSPVSRGILPLDPTQTGGGMRVPRSLRKSAKHFEIRVDTAFDAVVAACGDPTRDGAWIDSAIASAYGELHRLGWAHSVEVWTHSGDLVGGLYGVSVGGLFAGESMFHHARDASKVALIGLVEILTADGVYGRLLDVQWQTEHLETLGVVEIPRAEYLHRLSGALELAPPAWPEPQL